MGRHWHWHSWGRGVGRKHMTFFRVLAFILWNYRAYILRHPVKLCKYAFCIARLAE